MGNNKEKTEIKFQDLSIWLKIGIIGGIGFIISWLFYFFLGFFSNLY